MSEGWREPQDAIEGGSTSWFGTRTVRRTGAAVSSAETDEQSLDGCSVRQAQILGSPHGTMLNLRLSAVAGREGLVADVGRDKELGALRFVIVVSITAWISPSSGVSTGAAAMSSAPNAHALAKASISLAPIRGEVELALGPEVEIATAGAATTALVPSVLVEASDGRGSARSVTLSVVANEWESGFGSGSENGLTPGV